MSSVWGSPIPDEPAFQYWKCSDFPWTCDLTNPRDPHKREAEALARFKKHNCAEYNAAAARGSRPADRADRMKTLEGEARARALWLETYDSRADHEGKEDAACDLHSSKYARVVKEIYRLNNPK
jgi:hypothetical protein